MTMTLSMMASSSRTALSIPFVFSFTLIAFQESRGRGRRRIRILIIFRHTLQSTHTHWQQHYQEPKRRLYNTQSKERRKCLFTETTQIASNGDDDTHQLPHSRDDTRRQAPTSFFFPILLRRHNDYSTISTHTHRPSLFLKKIPAGISRNSAND